MKLLSHVLVAGMLLAGCTGAPNTVEFYVVMKPEETSSFIGAFRSMASNAGFDTAEARIVSDTGNVLHVIEGRGHSVRLWAQNMPLSGEEDPAKCGAFSEPHSDPAQFVVSTTPRLFGTTSAAQKWGDRILAELEASGFDVRRESPVCGMAALAERR